MSVVVFDIGQLSSSGFAHEFVGSDHAGVPACVIFVNAQPGDRVELHRHPYPELFFVLEGEAVFDDGTDQIEVPAGRMVVVPAGQPHGFANLGAVALRQIDVHLSDHFTTEWLEPRNRI